MFVPESPDHVRNCAVCEREFIPDSGYDQVCNAYACRIHGRVDITIPRGVMPSFSEWQFIMHPATVFTKSYLIDNVISARFSKNSNIVVITNTHDPSDGDVVGESHHSGESICGRADKNRIRKRNILKT